MDKEITNHAEEIKVFLSGQYSHDQWLDIIRYHKRHIDYFQMERLHHLIVTLSVGIFLMLCLGFFALTNNMFFALATIFLLFLFLPYIFHYYKLENGIQALYKLDKSLSDKIKP